MAHREGVTTDRADWTTNKASALIKNQKVITIDGSLSIEDACKVLIDNTISSAPIHNTEVKNVSTLPAIVHSKSYIGMFDYGDVIAYILLALKSTSPSVLENGQVGESKSFGKENIKEEATFEIKEIIRRTREGEKIPVKLASDLSRRNPFTSIMPETTLLSVVEEFARGTHRVCVLNPNDGSVKGVLSQTTVTKYIFDRQRHFPNIEAIMNKTLHELGLDKSNVISVNADSPVIDAFKLINKYGISSVAVLKNMGVVVGNISVTDIKHVMKSDCQELLLETCFQFVSLVRSQQGIEDGQDRTPVFDVRPETTLGIAVAKLLATKSHRVWVTEDRLEKAIGVVSITDVMRVIASSGGINVPPQTKASMSTSKAN